MSEDATRLVEELIEKSGSFAAACKKYATAWNMNPGAVRRLLARALSDGRVAGDTVARLSHLLGRTPPDKSLPPTRVRLTPELQAELVAAYRDDPGATAMSVARRFGVDHSTVLYHIKAAEVPTRSHHDARKYRFAKHLEAIGEQTEKAGEA